jgi:hypothetical protein
VVVLTRFERDFPEVGPGYNLENGVRHCHQGGIEGRLVSPWLVAHFAVELVVRSEIFVRFDRVDGLCP